MDIIIFLIIPLLYILTRLLLFILVKRYGKFSYDGFNAFGFKYDPTKDTFDSTKDAWQKNFGYTHLYDVAAPLFGMMIDTLPIKFTYDNKNFLLSFWKGQYGITTGGEVGLYYTDDLKVDKHTLYLPVDDRYMLDTSFILYKKNKYITRIRGKNWWIATFKLGMFSKPRHLSMGITINFKDKEMLDAFMKSFKKYHYRKKDYHIENNTFFFNYKRSHHKKVWTRFFLTDALSNYLNYKKVCLYNDYVDNLIENNKIDDSNTDKYIFLSDYIPPIFNNEITYNKIDYGQIK